MPEQIGSGIFQKNFGKRLTGGRKIVSAAGFVFSDCREAAVRIWADLLRASAVNGSFRYLFLTKNGKK